MIRVHGRMPRAAATARAAASVVIAVLLGAVLASAAVVAAPSPAWAAAGVTVANDQGAATAEPDYATTVTVSGTGFQSIRNGFGGVYVLFGWVDDPSGGSWRPSNGGTVGADYRYVPDSESADNQGYQLFVAFPGSETEAAAHAVMSDDGSWSLPMTIPGAVFESRDRDGNVSSVDCREVTCGVITIGAHGVKNANNETFTPVRFAAPVAGGGGAAPSAGGEAQPGDAAAAASGAVRVGLAAPQVEAGTSIVFTGQGFAPGEQVVATLDDGVVAVGPLAAGARGEVAGALPVPRDLRGGTHVLSLRGAASGSVAEAEVTVDAPADLVTAPETASEIPQWAIVVLLLSIVVAAVLVVTSIVSSVRRANARRRARVAAEAARAPIAPAAGAEPAGGPSAASWPIRDADPTEGPGAARSDAGSRSDGDTASPTAPGDASAGSAAADAGPPRPSSAAAVAPNAVDSDAVTELLSPRGQR